MKFFNEHKIFSGIIVGIFIFGGFAYASHTLNKSLTTVALESQKQSALVLDEYQELVNVLRNELITSQKESEINIQEALLQKIASTTPQAAPPVVLLPPAKEKESFSFRYTQAIPSSYELTVKWGTNTPSKGSIVFWPTDTPTGNTEIPAIRNKDHAASIFVKPGIAFFYSIEAVSDTGERISSGEREVRIPADASKPYIESITLTFFEHIIDNIDGTKDDKSTIQFAIKTNEPVKTSIQYRFDPTPDFVARDVHSITSDTYTRLSTLTVPKASSYSDTKIFYTITTTDQVGLVTSVSTSSLLADLSIIKTTSTKP